jgi:hypothetical protein
MTESKITATERLREEGRWDDASKFREEVRRRLKAEGISRSQANEQSWTEMLAAFPPAAPTETTNHAPEMMKELAAKTANVPTNLARDVMWVYANLDNVKATPADAPTMGAWSMLHWARCHRPAFFERILFRVDASKSDEDEDFSLPPFLRTPSEIL